MLYSDSINGDEKVLKQVCWWLPNKRIRFSGNRRVHVQSFLAIKMKRSNKKSLTRNRKFKSVQNPATIRWSGAGKTGKAGGRPSLPDNYLTGSFWSLVNILEKGWPLIGIELERIRALRKDVGLDSLRSALAPLRAFGEGPLYSSLFFPDPQPCAPKELTKIRHEFGRACQENVEAAEAARTQTDVRNESGYALHAASNDIAHVLRFPGSWIQHVIAFPSLAGIPALFFLSLQLIGELQKRYTVAESIHEERGRELARRESIQAASIAKRTALEQELNAKRAFFVQSQALDFLRDNRYALTPRKFAAALAGLTDMQWRQSITRCNKTGCSMAVDTRYQVLEAMFYILRERSPKPTDEAVGFFRNAIKKLPARYGHAGKYLIEHWPELKQVIENRWQNGNRSRAAAYAVTAGLLEELSKPVSAMDRLLRVRETF
jgi:hypothetical protein